MWQRLLPSLPADRQDHDETWFDSRNRLSPFRVRVKYGKH